MNSKTVKCSETYMKLLHIMVVVMRINRSDNGHNTVTATIPKSYLNNMAGKDIITELHKTAILGTTHILLEVLVYKYYIFIMRNNTTCVIHCNHRTDATLYALRNMTCLRYIIVNTLCKGDK